MAAGGSVDRHAYQQVGHEFIVHTPGTGERATVLASGDWHRGQIMGSSPCDVPPQFEAVTVAGGGATHGGRNAPGHPYEVGDKRRTRTCDRCQERPLDCVEQSEVEVLRSRSAGIAIFRYFDPCGPNMWVGTGCGGLSQASATISAPVQDARGGTTPLAEAVGARPIVDAMAATARTPASHWMMFCPVPIARHFRRVPQQGCLRGILVAMSITS